MSEKRLCPGCMTCVEGEGRLCPRCGGEMDRRNPAFLLPVGAVLTPPDHPSQGGWQVGAVLGQGGFGATYVGRELDTERRVAVKEYFPTRCARRSRDGVTVEPLPGMEETYEKGRYSFVKEARVLSKLEGMPSVVQALAYLELNNTAYLVMEYLEGTPLHRMVDPKTNRRIPPETLLPPLRGLLRDIGLLHEKKVIHRDIAPDNIMWMPDGTLKLLDFGSARSTEGDQSMTLFLKYGFAPVEQLQSHGQGTYTDVYAMAATIYYCLTATVPAQASERLMDGKELPPPTSLGVALAPEEESALMWGLAVLPKDRPQTMGEFSRALFPDLGGKPAPGSVPETGRDAAPRAGLWRRLMALLRRGKK